MAAAVAAHAGDSDPHPQYATDDALTAGLGGKSNTGHTHAAGEVTGLGTAATKNTGVGSGQIPLNPAVTAVAALNIDCSAGTYFTKTIAGDSTFTVSNVPASVAYGFVLELTTGKCGCCRNYWHEYGGYCGRVLTHNDEAA